ncbi:hypothetical protein, partial [Vreelandella nigrificans]|uniref:hypothetical protein n=1 Tax=Vreelandella nigrificans TaxID=2042704 RepID=UPI001AD80395
AVPVGRCWQRGLTIHSASALMNKAGLTGYGALNFSQILARILITSSTLLMLPFIYAFFIVFGFLGAVLRLILWPIVRLENSVIGQDQSPRFFGALNTVFEFFSATNSS